MKTYLSDIVRRWGAPDRERRWACRDEELKFRYRRNAAYDYSSRWFF